MKPSLDLVAAHAHRLGRRGRQTLFGESLRDPGPRFANALGKHAAAIQTFAKAHGGAVTSEARGLRATLPKPLRPATVASRGLLAGGRRRRLGRKSPRGSASRRQDQTTDWQRKRLPLVRPPGVSGNPQDSSVQIPVGPEGGGSMGRCAVPPTRGEAGVESIHLGCITDGKCDPLSSVGFSPCLRRPRAPGRAVAVRRESPGRPLVGSV